jgi:hypothetical protein
MLKRLLLASAMLLPISAQAAPTISLTQTVTARMMYIAEPFGTIALGLIALFVIGLIVFT